jgi:hypothetical protein
MNDAGKKCPDRAPMNSTPLGPEPQIRSRSTYPGVGCAGSISFGRKPPNGTIEVTEPRSKRVERRLAAIFAADVAGYSRLMEQDEVGTLQALTTHREALDRLIGEY